jgi:hypothetical protein
MQFIKFAIIGIILSGCSEPVYIENNLPSYSDMSAAKDAQEVLTDSK